MLEALIEKLQAAEREVDDFIEAGCDVPKRYITRLRNAQIEVANYVSLHAEALIAAERQSLPISMLDL